MPSFLRRCQWVVVDVRIMGVRQSKQIYFASLIIITVVASAI
jgi:hypothetical protein